MRERGCQNIRLSSSVLRPSLRVVCPASAVRAPRIQTSSRRQMLKMRLMAENEGGKEGDFAPLIDASAKSEKCSPACLTFPIRSFLLSLFLSFVPLNQVIQSSISRLPATFLALALHSLETRSSSSTSKCKCLFCSLPPVPSSSRPPLNRTGPQYSVFPCLLDPFLIFKSYPPVKLS